MLLSRFAFYQLFSPHHEDNDSTPFTQPALAGLRIHLCNLQQRTQGVTVITEARSLPTALLISKEAKKKHQISQIGKMLPKRALQQQQSSFVSELLSQVLPFLPTLVPV